MSNNYLQKWRVLNWPKRSLLVEAVVLSICTQLCLRLIPFRFLAPYLGKNSRTTPPQTISHSNQQHVTNIGWAVHAVARRLSWQNSCLVNSIVAKLMLRRRGIGTQLFLGLAKDTQKNLQAHAWLSYGDIIVTGQEEHERFVVMRSFGE